MPSSERGSLRQDLHPHWSVPKTDASAVGLRRENSEPRQGLAPCSVAYEATASLSMLARQWLAGDYNAEDLGHAIEPQLERIVDVMVEHRNRKTIVFLPLIYLSRLFADLCRQRGLEAWHVDGASRDRAEVLSEFSSARSGILSNAMLLTEGYDEPSIDCVVCLRPTKVRSLYCQIVGRGTRMYPNKDHLLLLDFLWLTHDHALIKPAHLIAKDDEEADQIGTMLGDDGDLEELAAKLIDRHKPDIVWADPLLNYIGDDISEQKVVAEFCCNRLNAIALKTGVIWALLHHTGKPSKDPKAGTHWTATDLAYSGLGSSALVNWSRETAVVMRVKAPEGTPPTFQLSMTKRRHRAGLCDLDGNPTDTIFIRHSSGSGICWEQRPPPPSPGKGGASYSVGKRGRPTAFDEGKFRAALEEFGGSLTRQNEKEVAAKLAVSIRTIWNWHNRLSANPS